eukprot:scaffold22465_cov60-Phaeocystis_antarctica.AAC.3
MSTGPAGVIASSWRCSARAERRAAADRTGLLHSLAARRRQGCRTCRSVGGEFTDRRIWLQHTPPQCEHAGCPQTYSHRPRANLGSLERDPCGERVQKAGATGGGAALSTRGAAPGRCDDACRACRSHTGTVDGFEVCLRAWPTSSRISAEQDDCSFYRACDTLLRDRA